MKDKEKTLLRSAIGSWVRLVNVSDVEGKAERLCIHLHGKLCFTDECYSVCSEDVRGHGTNSVSFKERHVEECFCQSSGIVEITLF